MALDGSRRSSTMDGDPSAAEVELLKTRDSSLARRSAAGESRTPTGAIEAETGDAMFRVSEGGRSRRSAAAPPPPPAAACCAPVGALVVFVFTGTPTIPTVCQVGQQAGAAAQRPAGACRQPDACGVGARGVGVGVCGGWRNTARLPAPQPTPTAHIQPTHPPPLPPHPLLLQNLGAAHTQSSHCGAEQLRAGCVGAPIAGGWAQPEMHCLSADGRRVLAAVRASP